MWILCALGYGILIGVYNLTRNQMLKKSEILVATAIYSLVAFFFVSWEIGFIFPMDIKYIAMIFGKGIVVSLAMLFTCLSLKKIEVSKVTILSCLSMVLSVLGGVFIFSEQISAIQIAGLIMILLGVVLVAVDKKNKHNTQVVEDGQKNKNNESLFIAFALLAALLYSSSSLIDKYLMQYITVFQMQFWFMFFVAVVFWVLLVVVCIIKKRWLIKKSDFKNVWIYISGAFLSVADLCLFLSYTFEGSKLSIIVGLTKISLIVAFAGGIIVFKESKTWQKFLYFGIILLGIVLLTIK